MTIPEGACDDMGWGDRFAAADARFDASPATYPDPSSSNSTTDEKPSWEGALYKFTGSFTATNGWSSAATVDTSGDAVEWLASDLYNGGSTNNGARWYGQSAILAYCWLRAGMDAGEREAALDNLTEMFAYDLFYRDSCTGGTNPDNNYYWAYLRNAVLWGIALQGETGYTYDATTSTTRCENPADCMVEICNLDGPEIGVALLDAVFDTGARWDDLKDFLNTIGAGGVMPEGSHYGPYLADYLLYMAIVMRDYGRDIYAETPFFTEAAWQLIYATTPKATATLSTAKFQTFVYGDEQDEGGYPSATRHEWGDMMTALALYHDGDAIGGYIREWLTNINPRRLSHWKVLDPNLGGDGTAFSGLPLAYLAPGSGYLSMRDTWAVGGSDKPTSVVFQLGQYDGGHGKCDAGSFQALYDENWMVRNAAGRSNTIANKSGMGTEGDGTIWAHTGITVNDDDYDPPCHDLFPTVQRAEYETGEWALGCTDLTAYAVITNVSALSRCHLYIYALNTIVSFSRVVSATDLTATSLTFLEGNATQSTNISELTVDDGEVRLISLSDDVTGQSAVHSEVNGLAASATVDAAGYRQQWDVTGATTKYLIDVTQIKAAAGNDLSASLTQDGSTFTITLTLTGEDECDVIFAKASTGSGGSIECGAGGVDSFGSTVQGITADETGITWN
jgi:hypothetical protein